MNGAQINVKEVMAIMKPMKLCINSSAVLPILESAIFEFKDKMLKITVTNLEAMVTGIITTGTDWNFSFGVSYKMMMDTLINCECETLKLQVDKEFIKIYQDDFKIRFPIDKPEEFPKPVSMVETLHVFEIKTNPFFKYLQTSLPFISNDDLRPAMTGIGIRKYKNSLTIFATDAHRLYWKGIQEVDKDTEKINIILPKLTTQIMLACLKEDKVNVEITAQHIAFYNDTFRVVSRLIDARYPDCETVISQNEENLNEFACKRKQFNSLVKFAVPFTNKSTKQIKFKLSGLTMEANTEDVDFNFEFYQKMPVYQNTLKPEDSIEIAMNGSFLMDALKTSKDEYVKVKFSSPTRALIMDECLLLMPLMINN